MILGDGRSCLAYAIGECESAYPYVGFEINPDYCEMACRRVDEVEVQPSLLEFFV